MKMHIKKSHLISTVVTLILLLICYIVYRFVIHDYIELRITEEMEAKSVIETTDSLFKIHRVVIYDNALPTTIDDTADLENISISLFSDIAIYLDNTSSIYDLTSQNTVNDLSISNIVIESNNTSTYLGYKNYSDFAKYTTTSNIDNSDIVFSVVSTNDENSQNDYSKPSFYTDCSNPITLGFVNEDAVPDYSVSENESKISYDGKILADADISLSSLNYSISFDINLTTNSDEFFTCPLTLNVNLDDEDQSLSTNGYRYSNFTVSGDEYKFTKVDK